MVSTDLIAIGAGLAIGLAGMGSAIGQGMAAAAAAGAVAENEKLYVKALTFAVLPETQAIYGFIVSIILIAFAFGLIQV